MVEEKKRDPYFRPASVYEYDTKAIELKAIVDGNILWSYTYTLANGGRITKGGFSGPFEALAAALEQSKKKKTIR